MKHRYRILLLFLSGLLATLFVDLIPPYYTREISFRLTGAVPNTAPEDLKKEVQELLNKRNSVLSVVYESERSFAEMTISVRSPSEFEKKIFPRLENYFQNRGLVERGKLEELSKASHKKLFWKQIALSDEILLQRSALDRQKETETIRKGLEIGAQEIEEEFNAKKEQLDLIEEKLQDQGLGEYKQVFSEKKNQLQVEILNLEKSLFEIRALSKEKTEEMEILASRTGTIETLSSEIRELQKWLQKSNALLQRSDKLLANLETFQISAMEMKPWTKPRDLYHLPWAFLAGFCLASLALRFGKVEDPLYSSHEELSRDTGWVYLGEMVIPLSNLDELPL